MTASRTSPSASRGLPRLPPLLALALLAGCGNENGVGPLEDPPRVIAAVVVDEGGPIFRSLEVTLDRPGPLMVDYWTGGGPRLRIRADEAASEHQVFLGRLRAGRTYGYEASSEAASGLVGEPRTGTFTTGALPERLREIEMTTAGTPTSPLTMIEAVDPPHGGPFPFVVDGEGHVVWYRDGDQGSGGFTRLEDGSFVFNVSDALEVVTVRNELVARLAEADAAIRTGIDPFTIHHDVVRTPDNTLLLLVQDTALVGDTVWTGEAVWEWDPATDRLEKRWASKDFFDPATDRSPLSVPSDWIHANSLALGPRGNVVVSSFWLHEVFSITPDFRSLEWRLGGPASSFEVEDDALEAGQHTAAEVAPGRVLLFDNGLDRPAGLFSRALEMELDEDAGVARVAWQFRPAPDIYAPIISSARRLENGNTVVGFGVAEGSFRGASGPLTVFEVTPRGEVVWTFEVVSGLDFVYRATPLATVAGELRIGASETRL